MSYHPQLEKLRYRYEQFWNNERVDSPLLQFTHPTPHPCVDNSVYHDVNLKDPEELYDWTMNPDRVIPRLKNFIEQVTFAGDGIPVVFPVSTLLVAIQAAYLGGEYHISTDNHSGWCKPIITDLETWPALDFDPDNKWWNDTVYLFEEAARALEGKAMLGIPDLQGGGQILDLLRGTEELSIDLIEQPDEVVKRISQINHAWYGYWSKLNDILLQYQEGYIDWLGVGSISPSVTVELDYSCMISSQMFDNLFLPGIKEQIQMVDRTIYHLDGPGALHHLDTLLNLDGLNGIQWVPGAGAAPMVEWLPLLKKIQDSGKLLVFHCEPTDVEFFFKNLKADGLVIQTNCPSMDTAQQLFRLFTSS